jgi:uroporphyrinogen-III synthase
MTPRLNGLRILNTRPQNQAQLLSESITNAGGIAIECPTIEIQTTGDKWLTTLPDLNQVAYALFISANAVHHCFSQLRAHKIQWPESIRVIAIGKGSEKALNEYALLVHHLPDTPDSEHLLEINELRSINNQTVLLFKGEGGRQLIESMLLKRGARVISLNVYKRVMPPIRHEFLDSLWREDLVDIILLTSEQSIINLFKMFNEKAHNWLQKKPCIVLSERLAKSASLFGIEKILISHPNRIMHTLLDYYQGLPHDQ